MIRSGAITMGVVAVLGASFAHAADAVDPNRQTAGKLATEVCSSCHGPGGRSVSPSFPNLAGQQASYIVSLLKAFRARTRGEPAAHDFMWGMAEPLNDGTISALADYYASQRPAQGKPADGALMAKGKELFESGVPAKNITACSACHGADAAGIGEFPRLAGQHADYTIKQLQLIQVALRAAPVMHGIVRDLGAEEIRAIATYLQSR